MGFSLNPFHDVAEAASDVKNAVVGAAEDVLAPINKVVQRPLGDVQHYYRYVHDQWTRNGVAAGLAALNPQVALDAFDSGLRDDLGIGKIPFLTGPDVDQKSWNLTKDGETYRDIYGRAVNPGFDLENIVNHVTNPGQEYVSPGYVRSLQPDGQVQEERDPNYHGHDLFSGTVNAVFDLGLDPTLHVGKVTEGLKIALGGEKVFLGADDAARSTKIQSLKDSGKTFNVTADGNHAIVGQKVLKEDRNVKLLVDPDNNAISNIHTLAHSNPGVNTAFQALADSNADEIWNKYKMLRPMTPLLAKANTVDEVADAFHFALTHRGYGMIPRELPTTGLTRRVALRAGADLPTGTQVGDTVAGLPGLRRVSSYRPRQIDTLTSKISNRTFEVDDPSFAPVFRDALLAAGHTRTMANMLATTFSELPDLGSKVQYVKHMMVDAFREAGVADNHPLIKDITNSLDQDMPVSMTGDVYGMDRHANDLRLGDPADGSAIPMGIYVNQATGKITLPDFHEIRKAVAESSKNKITGILNTADTRLYNWYTAPIFKNLTLQSLGMPIRIVAGEMIPAVLRGGGRENAGSTLMGIAAKLNPTIRDLSDEYGPEALLGHAAQVEVDDATEGIKDRTGRVVAVDHENGTLTVKHRGGETVHPYNQVTLLHRELTDSHIMNMAQKLGVNVTKEDIPHIRAAFGMASFKLGKLLVDPEYYDMALHNILELDGHLVAGDLRSEHGHTGSDFGTSESLNDALAQAGARKPDVPSALGEQFQRYAWGDAAHPMFWNYAIHEAQADEGARLGATAYKTSLDAGDSETDAMAAFMKADHEWMTTATTSDAEKFRYRMAYYGQDPLATSALRARSHEGLIFGRDGEINHDVLHALTGERQVPSIASLARRDKTLRPLAVKGRIIRPADNLVTSFDKFTSVGWKAIHPVINTFSRSPMYTMLSTEEYKLYKPLVDAGQLAPVEARQLARERAAYKMLPMIHDTKLRSQASDLFRNVLPFYFAQEQAYKRWGRALTSSPLAFRRGMILQQAITNNAIMRSDDNGDGQVVLPGLNLVSDAVQKAAALMHIPVQGAIPSLVSGNLISLKSVAPEGNLPSLSPLFAMATKELDQNIKATRPLLDPILGDVNENESYWDMIIPNATVKRALQATGTIDRGQALYSAQISVMVYSFTKAQELQAKAQNAQAAGNDALAKHYTAQANRWFPLDQTGNPSDLQKALDRMQNNTRILLGLKAVYGFISPLSPSQSIGDTALSKEFSASLSAAGKGGLTGAIDNFLTKHPDATAYTVFKSDNRATGTSVPETKAAYDWIDKNESWVKNNTLVAAYLVPQGGGQYYSAAYNQELAMGLRARLAPGDSSAEPGTFVNALYTAATDQDYYKSLDVYEKTLVQYKDNPTATTALNQQWSDYTQGLARANPIWEASRTDPFRVKTAQVAYTQLTAALQNPHTPDSPQRTIAVDLSQSYQTYVATYKQIQQVERSGATPTLSLTALQEQFNDYLDGYVKDKPNSSPLVTGIFRRLVDSRS